ncbi:YcnI family protein [Paenibacillus larvae]|nr:YcnI family protein [Paenibacillus larvae]AQR79904.1 nuclear export factor GLE1 [Paenibacillus larvae subsp. larvae]AVF23688.1 hypothetical protein ERICI_03955 [Paenibacillus larvae subsp. larvae]AVG13912.1 hypothetical protein ERICII_03617 [Paenibacillus larvae subsp. larvae DSM 25430]ETK29642.1 hypothetical protein ERIC1_1c31990 [Paenibacillus larvae subsp. larvae DSM 25719]MCY7475462.1 YcnI family protein [Paenibacillus larvae]
MKKITMYLCALLMSAFLFAGTASAHVTVSPNEAIQGSYQKFVVKVPTEKGIPTTQVKVKFDISNVKVSSFEPKPGWTYETAKDEQGNITGVTWKARGDGIKKNEFAEFSMQGKIADNAASITWKAYQTYSDGSIVEWTGAEGSDKPASITKVQPKPAGATKDSHGNTQLSAPEQAADSATNTPLYLSIAALVVSVLALLISIFKKKA